MVTSGSGSGGPSSHGLLPDEKRRYEEEGFFVREAVFAAEELVLLRQAAELIVSEAERQSRRGRGYEIDGNRYVDTDSATVQYEHRKGSETIRVIEPFHHLHPRFEALVADARIVTPVCGVIETESVALWTDKINLKRPREGSGFRWHQDSPYWTHRIDHVDRCPNVMIALDDASEANGCFRVIRGSHREGCLPGIQDGTQIGALFTDPRYVDESAQVALAVPAGSLVFFSAHTVHGSRPNESGDARRAIVLTYQPPGNPMFKREGRREFAHATG